MGIIFCIVAHPELTFTATPGPHEVGNLVEMNCSTNGIYKLPKTSMFNITVRTHDRTIFISEITSQSTTESIMKIESFIEAIPEYNDATAICQITTTSAIYVKKEIILRVYSMFPVSTSLDTIFSLSTNIGNKKGSALQTICRTTSCLLVNLLLAF